jgi:hydroxymethylglutaryl-CoA reductase (NADPH)
MTSGLRNRGKRREDVEDRRRAVEAFSGTMLDCISSYSFDPILAEKNIENMFGSVQIPVGFVGPILVNGDNAKGEFLVPMATTEGALIASVNRGCSIITASGGADVVIVKEEMTRAPVFRVKNVRHAVEVAKWTEGHIEEIKAEAQKTTKHGRLLGIKPFTAGRNLFLRFSYDTADAMGMNMATIATESASRYIEKKTGAVLISISGNMCVDKKPSAVNFLMGRGRIVHADITIAADLVKDKLHTTPEIVQEAGYRKNSVGSALSLSYGSNAHMANVLAAIFIATGQDPAQVVEGSMGMTTCEVVDGDLYISVRIPSLEVGTVGGGTKLPCQREALSIMDCLGSGRAKKFAEIIGAVVLAGELSTLAAEASGELSSAHNSLGR